MYVYVGVRTGRCVDSDQSAGDKSCEVIAWCPVEHDQLPLYVLHIYIYKCYSCHRMLAFSIFYFYFILYLFFIFFVFCNSAVFYCTVFYIHIYFTVSIQTVMCMFSFPAASFNKFEFNFF